MHKLITLAGCLLVCSSQAFAVTTEYIFSASFGQTIRNPDTSLEGYSANFTDQIWTVLYDDEIGAASLTATGSGEFRTSSGAVAGDASYRADVLFIGISEEADPLGSGDTAAVGRNAQAFGDISLDLSLGDQTDSVQYEVFGKYAEFTGTDNQIQGYGYPANDRLNFLLAEQIGERAHLHAWLYQVMGTTAELFGQSVYFGGDLHSATLLSINGDPVAEVPEPMTSALLLGGLASIAATRRSKALNN